MGPRQQLDFADASELSLKRPLSAGAPQPLARGCPRSCSSWRGRSGPGTAAAPAGTSGSESEASLGGGGVGAGATLSAAQGPPRLRNGKAKLLAAAGGRVRLQQESEVCGAGARPHVGRMHCLSLTVSHCKALAHLSSSRGRQGRRRGRAEVTHLVFALSPRDGGHCGLGLIGGGGAGSLQQVDLDWPRQGHPSSRSLCQMASPGASGT